MAVDKIDGLASTALGVSDYGSHNGADEAHALDDNDPTAEVSLLEGDRVESLLFVCAFVRSRKTIFGSVRG